MFEEEGIVKESIINIPTIIQGLQNMSPNISMSFLTKHTHTHTNIWCNSCCFVHVFINLGFELVRGWRERLLLWDGDDDERSIKRRKVLEEWLHLWSGGCGCHVWIMALVDKFVWCSSKDTRGYRCWYRWCYCSLVSSQATFFPLSSSGNLFELITLRTRRDINTKGYMLVFYCFLFRLA